MKKPMFEVLGTLTLPVYKLPKGVLAPTLELGKFDTVEMMGVYVNVESKQQGLVVLPDNQKVIDDGKTIPEWVSDNEFLLKQIDGSCSASCEEVKSELETALTRILYEATAEELIALRDAKLI